MHNWQQQFPQADDLLYLNHAAVAPCHYPQWLRKEAELREQLRALIGAPSADDIALLKNTSEGLSVIASGLPWQRGDQIIISNQEFPSNRIPWQALARHGVEVIEVNIAVDDPEQAIIDAFSPHTRLLAISSVQYGTGLRMDLGRLGLACHDHNVLFCVDAIQSLGALPMDVTSIHADFVVADGHKWMLGPEGLALFYCRADLRDRLTLHQFGWHMIEHAGDYSRNDWRVARDAKRFECGSPNMLCIHALSASLSVLSETGIETVSKLVASRVSRLSEGLEAQGLTVLTTEGAHRRAGIITFAPRKEADQAYRALMQAGVICAPRGGGVRLSPHFYTSDTVIDRSLALIEQLA